MKSIDKLALEHAYRIQALNAMIQCAVTRDDVQDPTGQRSNIPGRGFTRGFGIGTQYNTTNSVNGVAGNPINGEVGWAPGAIFQNVLTAVPGQFLWINIGTQASASWLNIEGPDILPPYQYTTGTTTVTFAAGQLTGAMTTIYNSTATTPGSIATRTALQMVTDLGNKAFVGLAWIVRIINASGSANTMTLTGGSSVTLSGTTTHTIAQFASRDYLLTIGGTLAAPTITMVNVTASAAATN